MNIKELAKQAWGAGHEIFWFDDDGIENFAKLIAAAERNRCIDIIQNYQIPVGGSSSAEIACEMTYSALKDIRDEIKGEKSE